MNPEYQPRTAAQFRSLFLVELVEEVAARTGLPVTVEEDESGIGEVVIKMKPENYAIYLRSLEERKEQDFKG